jgi:hypothetical protein
MKVSKSLAVAALALAVLSACGNKADTPGATPSSSSAAAMTSDEAKVALLAASLKTSATTYKMKITISTGGSALATIDGATDGQNKRMQMAMSIQGQPMEARLIGTDMYIKGMPTMPTKWVHMDIGALPGGADAFGTSQQAFALVNGVTDVTANPDGTFSGKADPGAALAKAPDSQKASLQKLVDAAKGQPLPFTATVKDGYLTDYTGTFPVQQSGVTVNTEVAMHLSDIGQPVTVDVPDKADVIELSDMTKK